MPFSNIIKRLQDIMRTDSGINGDAQRMEQIVWILFLKIYDDMQQKWEMKGNFKPILEERFFWRNWALDNNDGNALSGEELLNFVNNELFPTLKNLEINERTPKNQVILKTAFEDVNNYSKDGILLRKVINEINKIDFNQYKERHAFGEIYETFLKTLQSAKNAGEFYTPRALTDFIVEVVEPKLGESIADLACGTGGFLVSSLKYLDPFIKSSKDRELYQQAVFGIEKKSLPTLLCMTNLLIHDIEVPNISHDNSLACFDTTLKERTFDIILMNPPFGGDEESSVKNAFPKALQSSESADLFMVLILNCLKNRGAVILPDGFLFSNGNAQIEIKKKLLKECNLSTIIRLPKSIFAPYTSIATNILFFDKSKETKETWFYRLDMPEGYKNFSKTKPMKLEHFKPCFEWLKNKCEIKEGDFYKAKKVSLQEIIDNNYNLDICSFPIISEEILEPNTLITNFLSELDKNNKELKTNLEKILNELNA
ncbi:N-6 DNA methylase [Helicobacter cetorum]|uniref:class I SAM-dependent DNA methyltransferase n=1 Tax=Helicobacter cetorum TaxID=138563 RepID=UPI000CF0BB38|nr:N-6 DNA methylase [Helicobacter cetorum]